MAPPHQIIVPAGPDGRPGERAVSSLAPVPLASPQPDGDGLRGDFTIVSPGGGFVTARCLGPVGRLGDAAAYASDGPARFEDRGWVRVGEVEPATLGGAAAFRHRAAARQGEARVWNADRAGWLFEVMAFLSVAGDVDAVAGAAELVVRSWIWTDPPPAS